MRSVLLSKGSLVAALLASAAAAAIVVYAKIGEPRPPELTVVSSNATPSTFLMPTDRASLVASPGGATPSALTLNNNNQPLFTRPSLYDYGASIIQEGNIRKYWWCGQDPNVADAIFYRTYDSSTGQYSPIQQVLSPNPGVATWDRSYICDPSVIQGQFVNPANNVTYAYAMYYTATDRGPGTPYAGTSLDGTNNRIGIAYSQDGVTWVRYAGNPIILPQSSPTDNYGAGQAATYSQDGRANIRIFYTDFTPNGERLYTRTSTNGINFGPPTIISNAGVLPAGQKIGNGDIAFDYAGRYWYAVFAIGYPAGPSGSTTPNVSGPGFRGGDRERFQFGMYRMPESTFPSGSWEILGYVDTNLTDRTLNHNAALVRDKWGNVNSTLPNIETVFSSGSNDTSSWDFYSAYRNLNDPFVAFNRYFNGSTITHRVTTGAVGAGFNFERRLGYLRRGTTSGTVPLYGCRVNTNDYLVTLDSGCEGQYPLGVNGFIYTSPPGGLASVPLYRCYTGREHFVSDRSDCEGQRVESVLGYASTTN